MNGTQAWTPTVQPQYEVEDIPIDVPTGGGEQEAIPEGIYQGRLIRLKVVEKPEWKLKGEEGEDRQQFEWVFEITAGKHQGHRLNDYTNRTFHEKATAHKHAAALLGVDRLDPRVHTGTGMLAGRVGNLWVIKKKTQKGDIRNYIDKITSVDGDDDQVDF